MIQKILIVDDSPISRKILKSCIPKEMECQLVEAGDGLVAVELYKQHHPDVTFMDLTMPVMDGVTALAEIRKYDKSAMVIVLTADIQIKSINRVLDAGAFLVLKKPPTRERITDALSKAEAVIRKIS